MDFGIYLILIVILFIVDQLFNIEWLDKNPEWMIIGVIVSTVFVLRSLMARLQDLSNLRLNYIENCLGCEHFFKGGDSYLSPRAKDHYRHVEDLEKYREKKGE
jgi:hypothetical protein